MFARSIRDEEKARAGTLIGFALYAEKPTGTLGEIKPEMRWEATRTGRPTRAALKAAQRIAAEKYGECFVVEQRWDDRGRRWVESVERVVRSKV